MIAESLGSGIVVIHPGRINGNKDRSFENMVSGLSAFQNLPKMRMLHSDLKIRKGLTRITCASAH